MKYVVRQWDAGVHILLFAFEMVDGRVVFDDTRGVDEFREGVKKHGVPVLDDNCEIRKWVLPTEGQDFLHACFDFFCTDQTISSEARLAEVQQLLDEGSGNSVWPPAGVSAA